MCSMTLPSISSRDSAHRAAILAVADIERALTVFENCGTEARELSELQDEAELLLTQTRALDAVITRWLAAIDRCLQGRKNPADGLTCRDWLRERLQLTSSAASSTLRQARQLEQRPRIAAALRRGAIGTRQAGVVCRSVAQAHRGRLDPDEVEAKLISAAREKDSESLRRYWLAMRDEADPRAGKQGERGQRERRWMRIERTWSGSYRLSGELDPEGGALLTRAIHAVSDRAQRWEDGKPWKRTAEGLLELARYRIDTDGGTASGSDDAAVLANTDLSEVHVGRRKRRLPKRRRRALGPARSALAGEGRPEAGRSGARRTTPRSGPTVSRQAV